MSGDLSGFLLLLCLPMLMDVPEFQLQPVTESDLPAVVTTFIATFNAAPWSETWTPETATVCLSDLLALPRAFSLAAWDGPVCLGAVLGHDSMKAQGLTHGRCSSDLKRRARAWGGNC